MTGDACGAGNVYPSGAPDFSSGFREVHVVLSLLLMTNIPSYVCTCYI